MWWLETLKIGGPAVLGFLVGRLSKRLDTRYDTKQAEAAKAPGFRIDHAGKSRYRLVNCGTQDATGVTMDLGTFPEGLTRGVPVNIDLVQHANHEFFASGTMQVSVPSQFFVSCDQLDKPVPVAMPPRM